MTALLRRLAVPALILAAVGCGISQTTKSRPSSRSPVTVADGSSARPIELTQVTSAGLDAAVAEQKGKVVLLDAWFRACGPCVKKFPHVVELAQKYGPDGLVVMSVDVYDGELKAQDEVLAFLKEKGASFPNFILTDPDAFMDKYGITGTPALVLFDRKGQRIELPKKATDEEVEAAIRNALQQNQV